MSLQKIKYNGKWLYSPKYDRVFKAMFTAGNLTLLADFLSHILGLDIRANGIKVKNTEQSRKYKDEKLIRLDLIVTLADGSIINVEMQVGDEKNMGKRSVYNAAVLMAGQLETGNDYENVCPVITVNILDFKFIGDPMAYHNRFRMKNVETGKDMPEAQIFEINFIELPNMPKDIGKDKKLMWLKFFSAKTKEEYDMLKEMDPVFGTVIDVLEEVNADKDLRLYMFQMEKLERDRISRENAREKAGIEKGIAKRNVEVARSLIANDMQDDNLIANVSNLSVDEIKQLRNKCVYA